MLVWMVLAGVVTVIVLALLVLLGVAYVASVLMGWKAQDLELNHMYDEEKHFAVKKDSQT